jgi:5-methyltetrahydrofolate--homocysteine methyltransferase
MSSFLDALRSGRVLLMDGAMGTELQRAGLKPDECGELWNLTHPERVRAIHRAYVDAGAEVLLTNTFQANPAALGSYGADDQLETIGEAACGIARSCQPAYVLGDVGPISREQPFEIGPRIRQALQRADGLVVETCSNMDTLAYFLVRWGDHPNPPPLLLSLTFCRTASGAIRLYPNEPPEALLRELRTYPLAALGVNCGRDIDMDEIIQIVCRYHRFTDLPLFARPNAGTPTRVGDQWVYPRSPEEMATRLPELLEAGVCMVGGCCGTTPAHIAAFRKVIDEWNARRA